LAKAADMIARSLVYIVFFATLLQITMPRIARADMLVLESNVPEIPIGSRLPDKQVFALKPGERVKALLSSHGTKVFQGPPDTTTRAGDMRP
jgi:hypothetical protein